MRATRETGLLVAETLLHTALLPGMVVVGFPLLLLSYSARASAVAPLRWLGLLSIAGGVFLGARCTRDFILSGRGTPNPLDPPRFLVSGGPYRVVRNPMYVGVALILLGESLFFGSLVMLAYTGVVLICFHLFVVLYEEPTLRGQFGPAYEDYCRTVPRWIPRRS